MLAPGKLLAARYRLERLLGEGGAARMWAAFDLIERQQVGLKLLHELPASESFRAEFARLRDVSHPHLTRVRDYGRVWLEGRQTPFYTCDLVEGKTLRERHAQSGWAGCEPALRDALRALSFVHRLGLCHGDLKPDNILVDATGRGVLIDLGCAMPIGATRVAGGTPRYMAPELAHAAPVDPRADLFALGVTLRELSAEGPFASMAERLLERDVTRRPSSLASALAEQGLDLELESAPLGHATKLLGRSAPLERVRAALTRVLVRDAAPRCIWVQGARGMGSTRFLRELCFEADARFEVFETSLEHDSLHAWVGRALALTASGLEAWMRSLAEVAQRARPTLLIVHDVERGDEAKREELMLALGATEQAGNLVWIVSSTGAPPPSLSAVVERVELTALSEDELALWARPFLPRSQIPALHTHTGGFPLYVERTLAALARGALPSEVFTARGNNEETASEAHVALRALLRDLSPREQNILASAALSLPVPSTASARLFERGLLRHVGADLRLSRDADAEPLLQLLPRTLVRQLTLRALAAQAVDASDEGRLRRIALLSRLGRAREALALLSEDAAALQRAPRSFAAAVLPLVKDMMPSELVLIASLLRQSGEPRRALSLLARARRRAGPMLLDALRLEAAECYLAQGRLGRAARALSALGNQQDEACAECKVRLYVRQGNYAAARDAASIALAAGPERMRARLHEGLALACAYLGEHAQAQAQLTLADGADLELPPRAEARRWALRGFLSMRRADPEGAVPAYERALALADAHGLSDLVANALSNLASARHMLGSYGTARDLYERALRLSRALGRRQSELLLRVNLANVALECGAFGEARKLLDALSGFADREPVARALLRFRAELALLTGEPEETLRVLGDVGASESGERELNECRLLCVQAHLARGDKRSAEQMLALLLRHAAAFEPDLAIRCALCQGRVALADGREQAALAHFEGAQNRARKAGLLPWLAESEAALSELYARTGAGSLAEEQRRRAEARWERMALDLPAAARDAFWRHPSRAQLRGEREAPRASKQTLSLVRIVELSRRINAQRTIEDVLSFALDAALELTSAERGFVLLLDADTHGFAVKCQRYVDPKPIDGAPFEWSRTIAERVITTGEPVITLDAIHDPRFQAQASVHAMGLKSVLCVPIRGTRGLRGALYLDNRYLRSRFTESDAELVQAFAEQVAVALGNAQLFAELLHKQRELVRKQRKVQELLEGKERELTLLSEALAEERAAAHGTRFRYDELIGNSASLRKLFATLDRVIPTELPVMVRGESGTGKELVARAIHGQGPRAKGPFVGINCGALPEALLESELFGYVKGAFTGADRDKQGLLVTASGGTLFLDEIAELPLSLQVKLLRVLTEREVRPLGATRSVSLDVRVVAATHRDLARMLSEGSFREDLFYRLNVVEIYLPPLRERREDIIPIAERVLARRSQELGVAPKRLSSEAAQLLLSYPFPGNVRELENVLLRASALCDKDAIRPRDLGLSPSSASFSRKAPRSRTEFAKQESELLLDALKRERWNVSAVSRSLGIPRNTLYRKLSRLGLRSDVERAADGGTRR